MYKVWRTAAFILMSAGFPLTWAQGVPVTGIAPIFSNDTSKNNINLDPSTRRLIDEKLATQIKQWNILIKDLDQINPIVKSGFPEISSQINVLNNSIDNAASAKAWVNGKPPTPQKLEIVKEIVRWYSRPVWVVCNGETWFPEDASKDFSDIVKRIGNLNQIANATGMVVTYDIPEMTRRGSHVGTAIAVAPNKILTNRHVIEESYIGYQDTLSREWKLISSIRAKITFPHQYERCQAGTATPITVNVIKIDAVHESLDLAILTTDGKLPQHLEFPAKADMVDGDRISVIGYPSRPGDSATFLTPNQIDQVFQAPDLRSPFPAERIASGSVLFKEGSKEKGYFSYDATTWGGNSGSIVVSLVTGKILGLHSRGLQAKDQGAGYNEGVTADHVAPFVKTFAAVQ